MEIKSLQKAVNEKTSAHDSVVSLWQKALQELEEAKSSKKPLAIDDDVMTSKWKQLQYIIKNLSSSYLYGLATGTANCLTPDDLQRYRVLMPMRPELFFETYFSYLSQILIWDFITTRILAVPMIVWGQTLADSARNLMETIRYGNSVSKSDFHAFRAQTGEIMHNATNVDRTTCDSLKTELKVQVQAFTSPENNEEVTRQLNTIIDKAVELAVIFNQSRCFYHLRVMSRGRKRLFDANTMDKIGNGDSPYVYSVISPIFSKYGNSKGENYGEGIVLAKAAVLC
ncbi:hypothetical protein NUW58_g3258 [Xylaria curta]|uniref:Uncharacterized protein n=2 Tax=Xylaria curta TaxID=42375 RepID=A0ACC1PAF8_9PEZI|nr:hypothetical protein NUW58_g4139 [Xylaria curta]KAJ2989839.1 hypothetical protein NUW58_g3258 [Xylaria curta]